MKKFVFVILIIFVCAPLYGQSLTRIASSLWRDNGTAITKGLIGDKTAVFMLGHNDNVAATNELIWGGGSVYVYPIKGRLVTLGTTNAQDDTSGTGARSVKIDGLDSLWAYQTETVILAGLDTVSSSLDFARVWSATVMTAGSGGVNADTVYVMNADSDTTLQVIPTGWNQARAAMITVPAGSTMYVIGWSASEDQAKATEVAIWERPTGLAWIQRDAMLIKQDNNQYMLPMPLEFAAKSDVEIRANSSGGDGNVIVTFYGWYE